MVVNGQQTHQAQQGTESIRFARSEMCTEETRRTTGK